MGVIPLGIPRDIDKYFYNRKDELKKLNYFTESLNHDVSNNILLTGLHGVGKSFLLKKFITTVPDNILTVYIDISTIYGIQKSKLSEEKILYYILEEMNKSIKNHGKQFDKLENSVKNILNNIKNQKYDFKDAENILSIPIPEISDNYEKLSRFVLEFPQKVVDLSKGKIKGFIIIIDEFQLIGEVKSPDALFWLIRSFTQSQDNVSYIFTGSTTKTSDIVEKLNGLSGAFGNRMIQFNIEPFSEEETKNYLKEKILNIKFTGNGFKRFYKCTRGFPSNINNLYNFLDNNVKYNEEDIINEFYNKIDQIAVKWIMLWSSLSNTEKAIITTIIDNQSLKWAELVKKLEYSQGTVAKYLKKLVNKGIVDHKNVKYEVEDYMLTTWLKQRKKEDSFYPP